MKALLRSILLCLMLGTPALAEPTTTTNQNQQSLLGTWTGELTNLPIVIIFDNTGVVNVLSEKAYGDYKYYELPGGDYNRLISRVSDESSAIEQPLKYKRQGNIIEVTNPDGRIEKNTLDFTNNGLTLSFGKEGMPGVLVSVNKVSDSTEFPKNTESQATVDGHFNGLRKLVALQVAQSDYWLRKRRFASQIASLSSKVKPLPDSDRLYSYKLVKQSPRQSIIAAIPTQPNLRSFVLQLDRVGRRQRPFKGILCATDRPSDQMPPLPEPGFTCATKTHQIDFNYPIERSLLKVK
jgi:hypothetical protein